MIVMVCVLYFIYYCFSVEFVFVCLIVSRRVARDDFVSSRRLYYIEMCCLCYLCVCDVR